MRSSFQESILQTSFITILLLILFDNFYLISSIQQPFASMKTSTATINNISYFVLLPTTLNPRYLFPLPFAAESWKKIGVTPITIFIGKESEFLSDSQAKETLKLLKEQDAPILFFEPQKLPAVSMSQIIRLFGSVLEFFIDFSPDKTVLITSDADLMVFNLSNHIPNIDNGKTLHLYNSRCCHPIEVPFLRGSYKVHMYPMGTIGATIKTWKEIMGFDNVTYTVEDIEKYVINEFGEEFFQINDEIKRGSNIWFSDQSLISYKIDEWLKKYVKKFTKLKSSSPDNDQYKSERPEYPKRINRNSWPNSLQFSQMNIKEFDDAHLPASAYANGEWEKFYPFLKAVFNDDQKLLDRFMKYRENFAK